MRKDFDFQVIESQNRFQLKKWVIENMTNDKDTHDSETNHDAHSEPVFSRDIFPTSCQVHLKSASRDLQSGLLEPTNRLLCGPNLQQTWMDDGGIALMEPAFRQIDSGSTFPSGIPLYIPGVFPYNDTFGPSMSSRDSGFDGSPPLRDTCSDIYKFSAHSRDSGFDGDLSAEVDVGKTSPSGFVYGEFVSAAAESHNTKWFPHPTPDSVGNSQKRPSHPSVSSMPSSSSNRVSVSDAQQMHPDKREDVAPVVDTTIEGAPQDSLDNASSLDSKFMRKSPVIHTPSSNASFVKKRYESVSTTSANVQINEWILGADDAEGVSSLARSDLDSITNTPDSATVLQSSSEKNILTTCSRELLVELVDILASQNRTNPDNHDHESHVENSSCAPIDTPGSAESPGDAESSSGPSSSPKSLTTSGNSSGCSQNLKRPYSQDRGSCEGQENDDEPPSKKPNRGLSRPHSEDKASPSSDSLMPCPLFETQNCHGTNSTISELVRDLRTNHQVIICVECCTRLDYPEDGRKAEKVLAEHRTVGICVRKCINQSCSKDNGALHIRTPNCPSLRMVAPELWRLIWNLTNPGQEAPALQFITGVSCLHDIVRRPRTHRIKSNRIQEIAQKIGEDLEAKERRIIILSSELEASKNLLIHTQREHEHQLQQSQQESDHRLQRCTQQVKEQEEIILDLLERLINPDKELEQSLQRRLNRVCPDVYEVAKTCAKQVPSASAPVPGPPVSEQTPYSKLLNMRPSQQKSYVLPDFATDSLTQSGTQPASTVRGAQQTSQAQRQLPMDDPTLNFDGQTPEQGDLNSDFCIDDDWLAFSEPCQ